MPKVQTLPTASGNPTASQFNDAMTKITTAFDNTLSRDGATPNSMSADLDLNGNDILNVETLNAASLYLNGNPVVSVVDDLTFSSREEFVSRVGDLSVTEGDIATADGLEYEYSGPSVTTISDLPGWLPKEPIYPDHFKSNTTPGTTPMSAAILSAHNYVMSIGGGVVRFKNTTYSVDTTINCRNYAPVTWQGEGYFFVNDYTDTDTIIKGTTLKAIAGLNNDMVSIRASTSEGWVSGYPRVHGAIKGMNIHGNRSLDDTPTALDLNSVGTGIRLSGVSYFTLEDVLVFRCAQTGILTESYDYGDGAGARSCNNLVFTRTVAIGNGGIGMELYGGDSQFSDLVCGYNGGSGANISAGPVTNSLFWNNFGYGRVASNGAKGVQMSNSSMYDNRWAGFYSTTGGHHILTGCNIRNNGRDTSGTTGQRTGVLLSDAVTSITIDGCAIFDDDAGTQLRAIYSSGAPKVNLGANEISGPTSGISISDYTNVRMHGTTSSTSIKHPGFTAEGLINMGGNRLESVKALSFDTEESITAITSNTLACGFKTFINMNVGGGGTVNDITTTAVGIPILMIRNSNASSVIFTHNTAKLRLNGGVNVTLATNQHIMFRYVSGTVWQQM